MLRARAIGERRDVIVDVEKRRADRLRVLTAGRPVRRPGGHGLHDTGFSRALNAEEDANEDSETD
jgi:hypothetical protein